MRKSSLVLRGQLCSFAEVIRKILVLHERKKKKNPSTTESVESSSIVLLHRRQLKCHSRLSLMAEISLVLMVKQSINGNECVDFSNDCRHLKNF